jgi:transcription initiation factor TFIID subunit 1
VEVDRNQTCSLQSDYKDEQFRQLITPEQICQYESAQFGEQMLKRVGIRDITNADKISYATNKFCSEEPDLRKQLIARVIEEEVLSTPWNLSQNFNLNRQQKGKMMLEGIGDPSNGHGGYSYLKLPLKISQDSLNMAKINRMYLNPAIQNPKAVTGTDADLRKLSKLAI